MMCEMTRFRRSIFFRGGLVILLVMVGFGSSAMAQEETAVDDLEETEYSEIVTVTGSLIPRPTLEAMSPVTVMGVEEITYAGVTRIEDLMAQLPQAFAGQNSTWANGATGTATVDLRQLGTNRTLVLINGRRMSPGDASSIYAPDLNVIPSALIERVDVLTGGASSVYGTDAVAGVVNFVLDTDFEGFRGGVQYSFFQHDNNNSLAQQINEDAGFEAPSGKTTDGAGVNLNLAWGGKFADGRGHASVFIGYRNLDPVTKSERDYLNCSVTAGAEGPECGGSSTTPQGRFIAQNAPDPDNPDADLDNGDWILHWAEDGGDGHSFRERTGEVFNYGPYNHIQRPDETWNAGAFLNYRHNEHVEGYTEMMFMNNFTNAQIAPSGNFAVANGVNCDNPMLSDQQREILCGEGTGYAPDDIADVTILRRNVEGGTRNEDITHINYRLVAGIRGDINDTWSYDFYGLTAQTNSQLSYENDLNVNRMANALDILEDEDGNWYCRSGDDGCVPWNIFEEGAVTQESLDYMETVAVQYGKTQTELLNATFTGDLEDYGWTFPSATEGVQLVLGAESRSEYLRSRPDEVYGRGLAAGFGGGQSAVEGGYNVQELFMETLIPLVQDTRGARDLSMELGYRFSDYSTSGGENSYKIMASWAPIDDFKIRGGFNRAVRAANAFELFEANNLGLGGSQDICAFVDGEASANKIQCMRTGVTAAQYDNGSILPNPAAQYNTFEGGNPDLDAEEADTVTAGVVITPSALPGFSLALDYYDIEIDQAIDSLDADDIIQTCANTGDPLLCDLIHRDRLGTLWISPDGYTETTTQNIGLITAKGVDLSFSYMFKTGNAGFLTTDLTGTYLMESVFSNPLVDYDCKGYFGYQCGQPRSEWRHRARITWQSNFNTVFAMAWRYVGDAEIDDASSDPDLGNPDEMENHRINGIDKVDPYNWIDLSATWNFTKGIQWTLGINNIFDQEPPLFPDLADDPDVNLYASYEPLGRYIHTALRFDF